MLLSSACVALGVGVLTSKRMRTSPLSPVLDQPTHILLSVALGRFLFTIVHLWSRPGTDATGWIRFRSTCVFVSIICLSIVILTRDNLVLGAIILLLELEIAVEEASRAVERLATANEHDTSSKQDRLERALTLAGLVLVVLHILLPTTLIVIVICMLDSPLVLLPPQVGLLSFTVVFYTLTALVLLRRQLDRCLKHRCRRLVVPQLSKITANKNAPRLNVVDRRRPQAMSIDGRRRRVLKRLSVDSLLHAVGGRKVCSIDVYNAIRIAAASTKGLDNSNISSQRRQAT